MFSFDWLHGFCIIMVIFLGQNKLRRDTTIYTDSLSDGIIDRFMIFNETVDSIELKNIFYLLYDSIRFNI